MGESRLGGAGQRAGRACMGKEGRRMRVCSKTLLAVAGSTPTCSAGAFEPETGASRKEPPAMVMAVPMAWEVAASTVETSM